MLLYLCPNDDDNSLHELGHCGLGGPGPSFTQSKSPVLVPAEHWPWIIRNKKEICFNYKMINLK